MVAISSEIPQVYYVRIPDPDCKEALSKCQQVMVPVDEFKVQTALWSYDKDHNHVLDAADLRDDVAMAIPARAAQRLGEIVTGVQYLNNAAYKFMSPQAVVDFARAELAITKAYDTVQFLKSLPSQRLKARAEEVEYNAQDWAAIVARLGVGASAYGKQISAAHARLEQFVASAGLRDWKLAHHECTGGNMPACWNIRDAWVLDPTTVPFQLQQYIVTLAQKVAVISAFAAYGEIECEGWDCPSDAESSEPVDDHWHGPRVAVRMSDVDGKPTFLQLSSPFAWPTESGGYFYLPAALATTNFAATSFSK